MDPKQQFKSLSVVYAEDETEMRESVARLLRRRVGSLYLAGDGEECLNLVRHHRPDMILTDLEMPKMGGLEMIQHIRREFGDNILIIVLTAYKDQAHFTSLADAYVYKPMDTAELFTLMARFSGEET